MNGPQRPEVELDRRIEAWLDAGPDRAPDALLASTMAPIPVMGQRRRSLVALGRLTVRVEALARLAVAAALVVAVAGFAAFAIRGGPSSAGPTASPSASPSPSPPAAPPLPSGASYTNPGPLGAGTGSEIGKPGLYQTLQFRPTLRFIVPAGWSVGSLVNTFVGGLEDVAGIPLSNGDGEIVVTTPTSVDPPASGGQGSPVPADLIAWLAADPQLILTSGPTPVTIGGISGNQVEGTRGPTTRLDPADGYYRPVDSLPLLPRHHFRIAVLQIGAQQVIVATVANADVFETFRPTADAVIGSFVFPESPGSSATP